MEDTWQARQDNKVSLKFRRYHIEPVVFVNRKFGQPLIENKVTLDECVKKTL